MKKGTRSIFRIIISIVYIVWGIASPLTAVKAVLALDVSAMISAGVGILTLLAGIFGLFGMKKIKCRIFGIVIFVFALVGVVSGLTAGAVPVTPIINALLAWLYIICI